MTSCEIKYCPSRHRRKPSASKPSTAGAFTLIELLVVIAIIALLVSILLPSLKKAKELAMTVTCAANMHNTNTAMNMYRSDFEDIFVPCYALTGPGDVYENATWQQKLMTYAGDNAKMMLCSKYNDNKVRTDRNSYYVFMSSTDPKIGYNHRNLSCGGEKVGGFSCINGGVYRTSADITNPSGMIQFADSTYTFATFRNERLDQFYNLYASFPHTNGDSNYCFVDGHVETAHKDADIHFDELSWTGN